MYKYGEIPANLEPQAEIIDITSGEVMFTGNTFDSGRKFKELTEGFSYERRRQLNLPLYVERYMRRRFALQGRLGYAEQDAPALKYLQYSFDTIEQVFDFIRENSLRPVGVRVTEYDLETGPHDMNGMYQIPMVWRTKTSYTAQAWRKGDYEPGKLYLGAEEQPEKFPHKGNDINLRNN